MSKNRLFEYGGQWIGQERGRTGYYRYWYDTETRSTKKRSLRSEIFEEASKKLIQIVDKNGRPANGPDRVMVSEVLAQYVDHKYPAASRAGELVMQALDGLDSIDGSPMVSDLTLTNQRHIWRFMSDIGLSSKTISTYSISLRAAVNFAAQPQIIINNEGKEIEVKLLTEAPKINCNHAQIAEYLNLPIGGRREYLPSKQELADWIDAIDVEAQFRYVIIALNTWARNRAIFDLNISKQVNFEFGTIDLNPPGRKQTKKRRPVIRLTDNLRGWLEFWNVDKPIGKSQDIVEKPLNALGDAINMQAMTCYTLRHFMASYCRRTTARPSKEQRSIWLGHVTGGSRTTDIYEHSDPDYLEEAMAATDEILTELDSLTKRRLTAPTKADNVVRFRG